MSDLYQTDLHAWTQAQVDALRRRSANEIDWDNLLEEIDDLGQSLHRELERRLAVLITHLLKWEQQPRFRSRSWVGTVNEQRRQITRHLSKNPSLKASLDEAWAEAGKAGLAEAVRETGMAEERFEAQLASLTFAQAMTSPLELDA